MEFQSEMEDNEMSVTELLGMTDSSLDMEWLGELPLRFMPLAAHWKMPFLFSSGGTNSARSLPRATAASKEAHPSNTSSLFLRDWELRLGLSEEEVAERLESSLLLLESECRGRVR